MQLLLGKFLQRNWKELQAKARRGEPSRQPEGRVNDEANGQPKGHVSSNILIKLTFPLLLFHVLET